MATATKTNEKAIAHEGKVKRFCMYCGKEFYTTSKNARICDDCKAERQKEQRAKQAKLQKARTEKLGLVNIMVSKKAREVLKERAKEEGKNMYQIVDELVK